MKSVQNLADGWKQGREAAWNLLFPPCCPLCQNRLAHPHRLCDACHRGLPPRPDGLCIRCGFESGGAPFCPRCHDREKKHPDLYLAAFAYEGGMEKLLVGLKFGDRTHWADLVADLCWERLESTLRWEEPEWVVPTPLHPLRLIQRRYNQAALLAGALSRRLGVPLETNALQRVRWTPPQTRLGAAARLRNLEGAFAVRGDLFRGRGVLLVDDVATTGATLSAAAMALRQGGAARVTALCVARTLSDRERRETPASDHSPP
ncbi:MAG: ComF family protein [Magnetococcales bacterium]|nr:ComF family protein [Magnetococcales bacterium]